MDGAACPPTEDVPHALLQGSVAPPLPPVLPQSVAPPLPSDIFLRTRSTLPDVDVFAPSTSMSFGSGLSVLSPMSSAAARATHKVKSSVADPAQILKQRAEPQDLPAWPFQLDGLVIPVTQCESATLRAAMQHALRAAGVDYLSSALKWKQKCWAYGLNGGSCFFVLRAYKTGAKEYLIEAQLREGSRVVFLQSHNAILSALVKESRQQAFSIPESCLSAACKREEAGCCTPSLSSCVLPPPPGLSSGLNMLPPPPSLGAQSFQSQDCPPPTPEHIEEHFASVLGLVLSKFDDVVCAGARAAAAALEPAAVCAAIGARIAVAPPTKHAGPSVARDLVDALICRTVDPDQSQECRTVCALAVASLARDMSCAEAMVHSGAALKLLDGIVFLPRADLAELRRASVRAVRALVCHSDKLAATAASHGCGARLSRLSSPPYCGVDAAFDATVRDTLSCIAAAGKQ